MRRNQVEAELQRAVVEYLGLVKPRALWFHVPNGGRRNKREAAIFRGLGVKAGVPDLVFLWGTGCAGIELKGSNGRLTKSQKAVKHEFEALGIPWGLAGNLPEVEYHLRRWGLLRRS